MAQQTLHILGVAGTFMAGVAVLARALGTDVTGTDGAAVYPPMSTVLERLAIPIQRGYHANSVDPSCECVVIGNALSRGNAAVEAVLNRGQAYISGAQWVAEQVLPGRMTLAVAGTHGKTTTSTIAAWLLECAGFQPGFLIGGVSENFGCSARLGTGPSFVIEADEYDTAFFDKRSKFVHYRPRVAVLNNLEFDHADIFSDITAIERQFHHLIRTVPENGRLIVNGHDRALAQVLSQGCWTPVERFGFDPAFDWSAELLSPDGREFRVMHQRTPIGQVRWPLVGEHNVLNALAALAAVHALGATASQGLAALSGFRNVKRRLEVLARQKGVTVYDDFAHHPTAIAATLAGLRASVGSDRIVTVIEPRSQSMQLGVHVDTLAASLTQADCVILYHRPTVQWDGTKVIAQVRGEGFIGHDTIEVLQILSQSVRSGDHVVFMSNGGFDGIPQQFLAQLAA